ncbi:MAG TPA: variable large family protein [Candidatus Saccharimonadales bacterium]|nr:variable large family protein [Candidatus Saccharimonadales bacterium]
MGAQATEITNQDLLGVMQDLMQMTSDGFLRLEQRMDRIEGRMDDVEGRMSGLEGRLDRIERELREIKHRLDAHDLRFAELERICNELMNNQRAYLNDISDLLDRVQALEDKAPNITESEIRELQRLLKLIVDWALKVAKTTKVPLTIQ